MGIRIREIKFFIKEKNIAKAIESIKVFIETEQERHKISTRTLDQGIEEAETSFILDIPNTKKYHWIYSSVLLKAKTLEEQLQEFGYKTEHDNAGIRIVGFIDKEKGDGFEIFQAMSTFVEDGSYIEMYRNNDVYRLEFNNGKCTKNRKENL